MPQSFGWNFTIKAEMEDGSSLTGLEPAADANTALISVMKDLQFKGKQVKHIWIAAREACILKET